jgi:hypothetical protein
MDEESFAHPEVIRRLNGEFIPVRVDSDKRPDVNNRYNMGGWPTVVVLDPEGHPLDGGTYLPTGQLLTMLSSVRERLGQETESQKDPPPEPPRPSPSVDGSLVGTVSDFIEMAFDRTFGGFAGPPKFPQPWAIEFCLQQYLKQGDEKYVKMATLTLDQMRDGEIYDPVDGGFFRYATRGDWDKPHYEKLLETNTRLLSVYLDAHRLTGLATYRATAEGILEYLFSTLSAPGQPWFCGSQAADAEYYSLPEEIRIDMDVPPLDRTIYADRNAVAASALLKASHILGESHFQTAAFTLIDFLWNRFYRPGEGMYHFDDGTLSLPGYLSDQVCSLTALMDAYESTGKNRYLENAAILTREMDRHLLDSDRLGYRDLPPGSGEGGIPRIEIKPFAENTLAAMALTRLFHLTGADGYRQRAEEVLSYLSTDFGFYKHHAAPFGLALDRFLTPPLRVVIVGRRGEPGWMALLNEVHRLKPLWKVVIPLDNGEDRDRLVRLGYSPSEQALAYLCVGTTCLPPVSDPEAMGRGGLPMV